jgi:molybdopterin synthase catalytic subunit
VGDLALVAAVASAHRGDAFAACESLVETVKAEVPIWKKQYELDGSHSWVGL